MPNIEEIAEAAYDSWRSNLEQVSSVVVDESWDTIMVAEKMAWCAAVKKVIEMTNA